MPHSDNRKLADLIGKNLIRAESILGRIREKAVNIVARNAKNSPTEIIIAVRQELEKHVPAIAEALTDGQLESWLFGADRVASRIPAKLIEELPLEIVQSNVPGGLFFPGEPTRDVNKTGLEIVDRAIKNLRDRRIMDRDQFDALDDSIRANAFTVAHQQSVDAVDKIRDALAEQLREAPSLPGFRDAVRDVFDTSQLGPAHVETVYRTNIQASFAAGQEAIHNSPIVSATLPYARYDAIRDGRVREDHVELETLGMNGTNVYRADDPFWELFTPPWDFNCRCAKTYLTIRQAARFGVDEARQAMEEGLSAAELPPVDSALSRISFRPNPSFIGGGRFVA